MTLYLILALVVVGIVAGSISRFRAKKRSKDFIMAVNEQMGHYSQFDRLSDIEEMDPTLLRYVPVGQERVLAFARLSDQKGRLLLTDQALVLESEKRNERFGLKSLSSIQIYVDGIEVRKRTGSPKIFHIDPDPRFLGLAASILPLKARS